MPRHGVFLPPFNEFASPERLVELAVSAEEAGWDGLYLWDHVLRLPEEALEVADPFVALAAVAVATKRLRLGTMVTPLARRRPQVLARQVVTLDHLSGGRVTLGLGLGVDSTGELSKFGELADERQRGDLLDEGAGLLAALLSGEEVHHEGRYFKADGVRFLPTSRQTPRLPIWLGAHGGHLRPIRRAARYDGLFLIDADNSQLSQALEVVTELRGDLEGFDVAVEQNPGFDSSGYDEMGVSWVMLALLPEWPAHRVEELVRNGPPR
jgi:alkanesulfonate monooxygenase SsuD/methylene tetrahydromethanopterin reductase-like flavin-dependent oxidoreductase (luciferase family)